MPVDALVPDNAIPNLSPINFGLEDGVEWKNKYSVGVPKFDTDHMIILDLINTHLSTEINLDTVQFLLDQLNEYTTGHYILEEEHMDRIGFPKLADHQRKHIEMKGHLDFIRNQVAAGNTDTIEITVTFLNDWWNNHILTEDMAYKQFELENWTPARTIESA